MKKEEKNEQLYNKYELVGRVTKQSVYLKENKKNRKHDGWIPKF